MADYQFRYGGYNPSYEVSPYEEEWTYTSDHPSRPVGMDDHDGRSRYASTWNPNSNGYIVQTETYIVRPSTFGGHKYPPKADYMANYGVSDDSQWHRYAPKPNHERYQPEVEKFISRVQSEASRPLGLSPPVPRTQTWNRNPLEFKEFQTSYHSDMRRPVQNPSGGVGNYSNYPAVQGYGSYYPGRVDRGTSEPPPRPAFGAGGWANSSRVNPRYRRPGLDSTLSKPINDIDSMVAYLKDAIKFSSGNTAPHNSEKSLPTAPESTNPKTDGGSEVSKMEGAKPTHNSKSSTELESEPKPKPKSEPEPEPKPKSEPEPESDSKMRHGDYMTGTITSREAAKRFNGVLM